MKLKPSGRYHAGNTVLTAVTQKPYVQEVRMKPWGFWYAGGGEWLRWLDMERKDWRADSTEIHEVEVDHDRILHLRNENDMVIFTNKFAPRGFGYADMRGSMIDWRKVEAAGFAGIEIIPYHSSLRMEPGFGWYYPWDVASGCVWDVTAIRTITHIGTLAPDAEAHLPEAEYGGPDEPVRWALRSAMARQAPRPTHHEP